MRAFISWAILIAVFLLAGEGINLLRIGLFNVMAGVPSQLWRFVLGILLAGFGTAFLGGFIYYRAKKRGQVKRPDWMKQH